jgi:acyl-CoA synthetase (NDP forming)
MSYKNPLDLLGDSDINCYFNALSILKSKKDLLFAIVLLGQTGIVSIPTLKKFLKILKKKKYNCTFLDTDDEQVDYIEDHGFPSFNLPEDLAKGVSVKKR